MRFNPLSRPSRSSRLAVVTGAVASVVAGALVTGSVATATAAPKPVRPVVKPVGVLVPPTYFGAHFLGAGVSAQWPAKTLVGSVRLWDTGTTWADVQPTATTWNWTRLDAAVTGARARGADPLIVLGVTPQWASLHPDQVAPNGLPGSASIPRSAVLWRAYVQAVVNRYYKRGVRSLQTWNEPNSGFWLGTPVQLAALNLAAYQVVHQTVAKSTVVSVKVKGKTVRRTIRVRVPKYPGLQLVGPGMSTRRAPQRTWLANYYRQTNARYVDVVALHLYPLANGKPEDTVTQLAQVLPYLKADKLIGKPIWNTEVNFGGATGGTGANTGFDNTPLAIAPASQAAYVSRLLLLNAANGISRLFWYAWDGHGVLGVDLTTSNNVTLTQAGKAWAVTRGWMSLPFAGCTRDALNTYRCVFVPRRGKATVIWNPSRKVAITTPVAATVVGLDSKRTAVRAKGRIAVTTSPVLVTSAS